MNVEKITLQAAEEILTQSEGHFRDFKSKRISGSKLEKSVCAFANSDGGELYIGIEDKAHSIDYWQGFDDQEEANQVIQSIFRDIQPQVPAKLTFYEIANYPEKGLILHVNIEKSVNVHPTSSKEVYIRKGAQNFKLNTLEITNLSLFCK